MTLDKTAKSKKRAKRTSLKQARSGKKFSIKNRILIPDRGYVYQTK